LGWISKPSRASAIPGASASARPRRENRSARSVHPATHPGTVTLRGPNSSGSASPGSAGARPLAFRPDRVIAVANHDREQVTARRALVRLGDDQHAGGGERRVAGVPSGLERAQPGQRRVRVGRRDHAPPADGIGTAM
jgi:hypothetical protein